MTTWGTWRFRDMAKKSPHRTRQRRNRAVQQRHVLLRSPPPGGVLKRRRSQGVLQVGPNHDRLLASTCWTPMAAAILAENTLVI